MGRRHLVAASGVALLIFSACATTASTSDQGVGHAARQKSSGYEVREASESADSGGLQVRLDHGFISQEAAQEAVMRRWADLRRCYQQAGAAVAFAGGGVSLRFVVDAAGRTSDVQVTETRLGNFAVESCLIGTGRRVVFPRPQGGASATVDYTLEFQSTQDVPVVDLPPSEVEAEVPALHARIKSDCERLGAAELTATLYIERSGKVRSAGIASAVALDPQATACVWEALQRSTLPPAEFRGPGLGRVIVPLREADLIAAREPLAVPHAHSARSSRHRSRH